jgi:hypothetical protein
VRIAPVSRPNSLLTGNFTGNFAILGPCAPGSTQDTAVLQRFLAQFPKQIIREKISKNREFLGDIREFGPQKAEWQNDDAAAQTGAAEKSSCLFG